MRIKVNILNFTRFFETVNQCEGEVFILCPDGTKMNIVGQYIAQKGLKKQYLENHKCLPLSLIIRNPKDYLAIVNYYAGDC